MQQQAIPAVVVGTGFGCRIQVPALRGAGFEVAALVGTDLARTEERARMNGVPLALTDLGEAIDRTGAVLVAISTPPYTHAPLALEALSKGCHVLCEKPFTRDTAEAQAMCDAAGRAGKVNMLGNEFRYLPHRATLGRAIAEGMIGEPRFLSIVQLSGFVAAFEDLFPDWWFDPAQGGGWLGASASHLIDQIRAWLGEFDSISASLTNVALTRGPVEDLFSTRFRLKNGVQGVLQQSSGAFGPMDDIIRVAGSEGSIWIAGETVRFADRKGEREVPIPADLALPPPPPLGADPRQERMDWAVMAGIEIAPYTELCRTLRAAILDQSAASPVKPATFADGLANMRLLDAIRASARDGGRLVELA